MQMAEKTKSFKCCCCWRILTTASLILLLHWTTRTVVAAKQAHGETSTQNIADFSCIAFGLYSVTCAYKLPTDSDGIKYSLTIDERTPYNTSRNATHLYWNARIEYPSRPEITFNLTAKNSFGKQWKPVNFSTFDKLGIIKPNKIDNVLPHCTSDSVVLDWSKPIVAYYWNISYDIRVYAEGYAGWSCMDESCSYRVGRTHNVTVKHLPYADHEYQYEVRHRIVHAGSLWSDSYKGDFKTLPCRPRLAPNTAVGGFYIADVGNNWTIYWQQMPKVQYSGPNFRYVIAEVDDNGQELNVISTNETSRVFQANEHVSTYHIRAANDQGESDVSSVIRVYPGDEQTFEQHRPREVVTDFYMSSYTLSWKVPLAFDKLTNYTVFWCDKKAHTTDKCSSAIDFIYLDKYATNFTKKAQDTVLIMAVSANYIDHATGIVWGKCNGKRGAIPSKLYRLQVVYATSTTLQLKWDWEGKDAECAYLLKGYEVVYSQVENDSEHNCSLDLVTDLKSLTLPADQLSGNITDLEPNSFYCIKMRAFAEVNGLYSDAISAKTSEGAPTPPLDLNVDTLSITSNSAVLRWHPPAKINGLLRNYTIWYVRANDSKSPNPESKTVSANAVQNDATGMISYTLDGLSSYTNYTVYVTAHTASIEGSGASIKTDFLTKIAVPSEPRNVIVEKSDGNNYILEWMEPQVPSGRVEIYEISMIITLKNGTEEEKTSTVNTHRTATGVHKCQFQFPYCDDTISERHMRVRAINVAQDNEYDQNLNDERAYATDGKESFECELTDEEKAPMPPLNKARKLTSSWKNSTRTDMCTRSNYTFAMIFGVIFVIFFTYGVSLWVRKKYLSMKNINPVLPQGLVIDLDAAENVKKSSLSSSFEWLMYDDKTENAVPNGGTWNPAANINATNTSECENEKLERNISETSSEVQTTQSTGSAADSCESQFNNSFSSIVCNLASDDDQELRLNEREPAPAVVVAAAGGAYVTPALLYSTKSVLTGNNETGRTHESAPSGYVQPHKLMKMPLASVAANSNTDGYITADAINATKFMAPMALPTQKPNSDGYITADAIIGARSTYPDLLDETLASSPETSVSLGASNEASLLTNGTASDASNTNSSSTHNLISGYVTQQQLAKFRQLIH